MKAPVDDANVQAMGELDPSPELPDETPLDRVDFHREYEALVLEGLQTVGRCVRRRMPRCSVSRASAPALLRIFGSLAYRRRRAARQFDFRGKIVFTRFDGCEFVKCAMLIDHETEQLAFTFCLFKDCNIDKLEPNEERGLYVKDNFFDRPLEERRAEFETKLAQTLADRKATGK